jgi:hypothetical protein
LLAPLALASLTAGACNGGATIASSTSSPTTSLSQDLSAARGRFVECLEIHGVPAQVASVGFGDRRPLTGSPAPTPSMTLKAVNPYREAFEACRNQLPSPGLGGMRGTGFLNSPAGRAYASCLADHGLPVPAPTSAAANAGGPATGTDFRTAEKACAGLEPKPALGGSTSTTTAR